MNGSGRLWPAWAVWWLPAQQARNGKAAAAQNGAGELTGLSQRSARAYLALSWTLGVGAVLAGAGGVAQLVLDRHEAVRDDRAFGGTRMLAEQVLLAERNCQRYLLTGDAAALDAYRMANDGIGQARDRVSSAIPGLLRWDPALDDRLTEAMKALGAWRMNYALPAIEYRLSQRWQEFDDFNRQTTNAQWHSDVEARIADLDTALRSAAAADSARLHPFILAGEAAFALGIALIAGAILLLAPLGLQALGRLKAHSRLAESLISFSAATQVAEVERDIAAAIGRNVVGDLGEAQCNVIARKGRSDGASIIAAFGGQESRRRASPILESPRLCPVIRSGRRHDIRDVRHQRTCNCPLGVPVNGGYACVPLMSGRRVHGVVNVQSRSGAIFADRQHVEHLNAVARISSLAITSLDSLADARRLSITDPLTGAFNRRHFESSLRKALSAARVSRAPLSLVMFDLDHFKRFNDSFGHQAGDRFLQEFVQRVKRNARDPDIVARYGGEEFIMMMPGANLKSAGQAAERIRTDVHGIGAAFQNGHRAPATSVSIGVAGFPHHGSTPEAAVRAADRALYRAKDAGRDRVVVA